MSGTSGVKGFEESGLGLDDWLSKVRQNRTEVVDWAAVRRIAGELSGTAASASRGDETERTLCRYTAEDLQGQLGRAMRGEDP